MTKEQTWSPGWLYEFWFICLGRCKHQI